ncbi:MULTISPECIES: CsbD family protein [unclassified Plantactinospora]|uniref:CsbD family protein n=1 Tax=unclassified Plantactinospora TaxID=2631981 RepID=UPI000D17C3D4|nr:MULTISPECIES: CsbD family protein [unclassified Plantactinospora]AVT30418.1 CsbD family protein [Plantactinospora sp. BC1]AVT36935.1 CsbD family protein [Plantactinospora sp. BB1]
MGMGDKIRHKIEEVAGAAKEKTGEATDNDRLRAEGATEQTEANVKQAGDHVVDAARDTRDAFRP